MKKIVAIALSLCMLLVGLLALVPTAGAEELPREGALLLYAQVPEAWEAPGLWAWGPNGNLFANWPGEAFTADPANDGWFYMYVPAGLTGLIVNEGFDGGAQTADIKNDEGFAAGTMWITVEETEDGFVGVIAEEALTEGDEPEYVPLEVAEPEEPGEALEGDITVHLTVPASWTAPCFYAWPEPFGGWPGLDVEAVDGYAEILVPAAIEGIVISNDGSPQTVDITEFDKGVDLWITVLTSTDDGKHLYELSYAPMVTVHIAVPNSWTLPCFYAWPEPFGGWPGADLTVVDGWAEIKVPANIEGIVLNNDGSVQTTDITDFEPGVEMWITVSSTTEDGKHLYEIAYTAPEPESEPEIEPEIEPEVDEPSFWDNWKWFIIGGGAAIIIIVVVIILLAGKKKKD
ncbi:MAG: starch-binding protein [Clostridiales bacterium]|nr:starch-binding protein [Clostridiales bacterium]